MASPVPLGRSVESFKAFEAWRRRPSAARGHGMTAAASRRSSTTSWSRNTAAARSRRPRRCWRSPSASATPLQALRPRRGRGLGDGQDDRPADRDGARGRADAARPRDGSAARLGRADRGLDGRARAAGARHPGGLADREPVRHPHRRLVQQGAGARASRRARLVQELRRRPRRDRRRLPGRHRQRRHHDARPRRRRHHRRGRSRRRCRRDVYENCTDVDGVYTADPRVVTDARRIPASELRGVHRAGRGGAKVLHPRAAEICMQYKVPIHVRHSFSGKPGTWVREGADDDGTPLGRRRDDGPQGRQGHAARRQGSARHRRRTSSAISPTRRSTCA